MKYTEVPEIADQLVTSIEKQLADERGGSEGPPHVSDVIYCLKKSWRRRHGYPVPEEDFNHRLILLVGQALHAIHAKASGSRIANVKLVTPWLVGSADARLGGTVVTEWDAIEEFKTARAGTSVPAPEKWPHYVEQVAAYLVLARELGHKIRRGILTVLHLTFTPPKRKAESWEEYALRIADDKHLRSWPLEFTDTELDKWRDELKRRATIVSGDKEPSAANAHYSWECDYCPFSRKYGGNCGEEDQFRPASFFIAERIDDKVQSN